MSTCAVMLVRDEADIIEVTVRHLLWHVDEVIVADNRSVDGTREILEGLPVDLRNDPEVGYGKSRKTTALAMEALDRGHGWVLPCDADEIWHCRDSNDRIGDWLSAVASEVMIVKGEWLAHVPSAEDDPREENPVRRIGYRKIRPGKKKVVCRLASDLRLRGGPHKAHYGDEPPEAAVTIKEFKIRHFDRRSEEQTVRKYRNQIEAYGADGKTAGPIMQPFDGRPDEDIRNHFRRHIFSAHPSEDDELIYDPAPARWPA